MLNRRRSVTDTRAIPEHESHDGGSDDDDDYGPPVAACVGPAADEGPTSIFKSGSLGSVLRPQGSGRGGVSGGTAPSRGDSGDLSDKVQPVSLAQAYSTDNAPPMVEAEGAGMMLATMNSGGGGAAGGGDGGSGGGQTVAPLHGGHAAPHSHLPGMTNTVQGLLEDMASRRAQLIASRIRRPRR